MVLQLICKVSKLNLHLPQNDLLIKIFPENLKEYKNSSKKHEENKELF